MKALIGASLAILVGFGSLPAAAEISTTSAVAVTSVGESQHSGFQQIAYYYRGRYHYGRYYRGRYYYHGRRCYYRYGRRYC
jgi:hypothetical protein